MGEGGKNQRLANQDTRISQPIGGRGCACPSNQLRRRVTNTEHHGSLANQHASLLEYSANQGTEIWYRQPISAQESGTPGQSVHRNPRPPQPISTREYSLPSANWCMEIWYRWPITTQESGAPGHSACRNPVPSANQHTGIWYPQQINTRESAPPSQSAHRDLAPPANHQVGIWYLPPPSQSACRDLPPS